MKKQSALAHDMARLAKFWYKSACITDYVYGAKYAMELIAVKACEGVVERHHNENVHLIAFQKFLGMVEYFESLDVIFNEEYRLLNEHQPAQVRAKPSVLDPANPYNNLAKAFMGKPNATKALKLHAKQTFEIYRRMNWEEDKLNEPNFTLWRIINIFNPRLFDGLGNAKVMIDSRSQSESKLCKPIEVRTVVSDAARKKIEFMQVCLTAIIKKAPGNLQNRLEKVYKSQHPNVNFGPGIGRVEDFDTTISLNIDNLGAAIFSFDVTK